MRGATSVQTMRRTSRHHAMGGAKRRTDTFGSIQISTNRRAQRPVFFCTPSIMVDGALRIIAGHSRQPVFPHTGMICASPSAQYSLRTDPALIFSQPGFVSYRRRRTPAQSITIKKASNFRTDRRNSYRRCRRRYIYSCTSGIYCGHQSRISERIARAVSRRNAHRRLSRHQ